MKIILFTSQLLLLIIFPILLGAQCWQSISAGGNHSLAIKSDGTLWAWGENLSGALGDGTTTDRPSIVKVGKDNTWRFISAGNAFSFAIKTDGTLWSWGINSVGQLGNGTEMEQTTPKQVGVDKDWESVSAAWGYAIAIKTDGTLWGWGGRTYNGSNEKKSVPTKIGVANDWLRVSAGNRDILLIKKNGTLWAWGVNHEGAVGDGTNIIKYAPTQIGSENDWKSISCGSDFSLALKSDGTLWAWGQNRFRNFGDGTLTNNSKPTKIGKKAFWNTIEASNNGTGIKQDGSLWTWGSNNTGQLGDGTTIDRGTPVKVGNDKDWQQISSMFNHTLALKSDGTLWSWGTNYKGQLGDGSFIDRYNPLKIECSLLDSIYITKTNPFADSILHRYDLFRFQGDKTYYSEQASLSEISGNEYDRRILGTWRLKYDPWQKEGMPYRKVFVFTIGNSYSPLVMTTFIWNEKEKRYKEEYSNIPNLVDYRRIFPSKIGNNYYLERRNPVWDNGKDVEQKIPLKYTFISDNSLQFFAFSSQELSRSTQFSNTTAYRNRVDNLTKKSSFFLSPAELTRITSNDKITLPESKFDKEARAQIAAANDQLLGMITLFIIGGSILSSDNSSSSVIQSNSGQDSRTWGYDKYGNSLNRSSGSDVYYDANHNRIKD